MYVVAVVSQKGGSGKTTLTGHLSVQASLAGAGPVAIIDTDPQGSLAAWWNERETDEPVFVQTNLHDLGGHLDNLRRAGIEMVFIDTPPAITTAIHDVISVADYVVVPTKPSPHDLRAVGATVKLVQSCNKPMVFVLNDASPRAKITFEAAIALSQHGTVAPVTIHHRTIFASSMIDGRSAMELDPNGQSASEITGLWEYLNARLNSEILPTSIGLDATRRFDGTTGGKKAFDAHLAGNSRPTVVDDFDDEEDEIVAVLEDEGGYDEVVVASAPSLVRASESRPVAQPLVQPVETTRPASRLDRDVPVAKNGDELWSGFADVEAKARASRTAGSRQPALQVQTGNSNHNFGNGHKVFGRRQSI